MLSPCLLRLLEALRIIVRQERQRITSNVELGTGAPLSKKTHMLIANSAQRAEAI